MQFLSAEWWNENFVTDTTDPTVFACGWCSAQSAMPHREGWRPAVEAEATPWQGLADAIYDEPVICHGNMVLCGPCCPDCQTLRSVIVARTETSYELLTR